VSGHGSGRRVLAVLGHSLHVRNFVTSGCLDGLARRGHVLTLVMPRDLITEVRRWRPEHQAVTLEPIEPHVSAGIIGLVRTLGRLASFVQREHLGTYRHKVRLAAAASVKYRFAVSLFRALKRRRDLEAVIRRLEARRAPRPASMALVDRVRPDLVFCPTLIHDGSDVELLKAARAHGVPIAAFAATWDTLTSKGCFLVPPDALLVWGEESRRHAVEFHDLPAQRVFASGAPHLDIYGEGWPVEPRERFLGARGIDPGKRVILFAGTTISYWEDEPGQLRALSAAVAGGELKDCVIWYRPHPRRRGRDVSALGALPGVYVDDQVLRQKREGASSYSTRPDDLGHYRDLMEASEAVVAAFSTMILEAALLGKPSLVVGFDLDPRAPARLFRHAEYEHSVELLATPGVTLCRSLDDLKRGILRACSGEAAALGPALRAHAGRIANNLDGRGRERIVATLEALATGSLLSP
jgi:hypothetical protein